ncbi:MAG: prephenate dehydratase domain-containing protein [bacterium]|nr:prephenate dehydratase domain-containing protein [bacterium]
MKTKLALSGAPGSFSDEAASLYSQREGIDAELIYTLDMEGVLTSLDKKEADIGIFPVVNSRGGLVHVAFQAMGGHLFEMVGELWLEVHQCLMVKPNTTKPQIQTIASHPQALVQCERYLKHNFPDLPLIEWIDTAEAAKDLAMGKFSENTAVIAPARAASLYGLKVLEKGIQDVNPNLTTFIIVKK